LRGRTLTTLMWTVLALAATAPASALAQDDPGGTAPPSGSTQPPPSGQQQQPAPQQAPQPTGGREYGSQDLLTGPIVPGAVAQIVDGIAYAPQAAPLAVQQAIWAGNRIVGLPYIYGGGHNRAFQASGYDCSGTVSFALHGGGLLRRPRDSSSFMHYGLAGPGAWITIFTNPGHAYMTVAGIRLDTSSADDPSGARGPQWRPLRHSNRGFRVRHPVGL